VRAGTASGLVIAALLVAAAPVQAGLSLAPAYTDSASAPVSAPIYATAPPGDPSRLFVVERAGRIRVAVDGAIQQTPFLDISSRVTTTGEAGLLSMAFAPDYATSRKFYVYFIQKSDGHIHVEEFTRSLANPNVADPAPTALLVDVAHPTFTNHYGGQIAFGPDGKLYAGTGDGGSSNDPAGNAQNPGSQLGKLLAIDTAGAAVTTAALGLRNPFRFSFDRGSGDLVLGDVGQAKWEEVDWVPAGDTLLGSNFGWDCWEANEHVDNSCDPSPRVAPVIAYANPNGSSNPPAAVTGGVVVRDPALGPLFGRYLYADFYAGVIHSAALAKPVTDDRIEPDLPTVPQLVAFGEDADGHIYVVSLAGTVQRIVCDSSCAPGSGGGTTPTAPQDPGPAPPAAEDPPPAAPDTTAPRLSVRAARLQRLLLTRVVRLSVACDERCIVRVSGKARGMALRGVLKRLEPGNRASIRLPLSKRIRRALARRGSVALQVRARDDAGNLRTARLTVRVKRG
jgi:glucose/arabinose dehydrogenase